MANEKKHEKITHRFLIRTCTHEGTLRHPEDIPERRVDGRNAAEMLEQYYTWAAQNFPDSKNDEKTYHISLGDEIIFYCPEAMKLLSERPDNTVYMVGNHEYKLLEDNQKKTRISAREAFQNATGSKATSHFMTFGPVGAILLNPTYYEEARLVPRKNMLADGLDLSNMPPHFIIRNYIPEQDLDRLILACKENIDEINAWIVLSHTPPQDKLSSYSGKPLTRSSLPETLICNGTPPQGVTPDENGEFRLIHAKTAIDKIRETLGRNIDFIGGFYGDEHPPELQQQEENFILPAFSRAADKDGHSIPSQGNIVEVTYRDGQTKVIPHKIAEKEKSPYGYTEPEALVG